MSITHVLTQGPEEPFQRLRGPQGAAVLETTRSSLLGTVTKLERYMFLLNILR